MIHMRNKSTLACLLIMVLLFVGSVAFAAEASSCTVTATKLILREEANANSEALASIRQGTVLEIVGKTGKWYKVTYGNYTGYVYSTYVELIEDDALAKGSKGDAVKDVQKRLKELGYYDSTCDGNYGNVTVNAVKAFQKKNGLTQDGVVDSATLKKLNSSSAITAKGTTASSSASKVEDDDTLKKGSSGTAVKNLQKRLKELGYYDETCDGDYGNQTVSAVKAFQKKNGLSQTGIADSATLKKLNSSSAIAANGKVTEVEEDSTLKRGSKGTAVKQLQQRLKELGYYKSTCDSDYGYATAAAVKAFQKKNGLSQTGTADSTTLKKLNSSSAIGANDKVTEEADDVTLKRGSKGTAVKELQTRLKALGYYKNVIDSEYGSGTVSAVKAFQKKNGLSQTGTADAATLKKIYSTSAIAATDKVTEDDDYTTLKRGSKGTAVKELQTRLKALGYYKNVIDSEYGSGTVSAVKAFQKKNGLSQTGTADAATLKKVYSTSAIAATDKVTEDDDYTTLKRGSKGTAVKELQTRLKALGYYKNAIDSEYGSGMVAAVKAFQKRNGLSQTGTADAATLKKVYSTSAVAATDKTDDTTADTSTTLKQGSSGTAVKQLQQRLKELGYYTTVIDSDYGSKTVAAVKAFQKKNDLTQTGTADAATLKKIYSTSAIAANDKTADDDEDDGVLKKGSKGTAVKELQTRLKELGYYKSVIDGEFGSGTVTAVKAFQKKNGLTQSGIVDEDTQKKLDSDSAVNANGGTSAVLNTAQTLSQGDSGSQVKALQLRLKELGYYTTTIDSDYGYKTATAVSAFQRANGLNVTGTANSTTLKKLVSSSAVSKSEADKKEEDSKTYVTEKLDWFKNGKATFPNKAIIQVKDVRTGLVFKAQVLYGTNHLDVEPLTKEDTAILLKINGGVDFSYKRRPMLVKYNGHVYASSIYSEPHGDQTILDNNFDGQFCLHFYGSKLHKKNENGVAVVDAEHQACVAEAMKATW